MCKNPVRSAGPIHNDALSGGSSLVSGVYIIPAMRPISVRSPNSQGLIISYYSLTGKSSIEMIRIH